MQYDYPVYGTYKFIGTAFNIDLPNISKIVLLKHINKNYPHK